MAAAKPASDIGTTQTPPSQCFNPRLKQSESSYSTYLAQCLHVFTHTTKCGMIDGLPSDRSEIAEEPLKPVPERWGRYLIQASQW